jgi:hypothetical protein
VRLRTIPTISQARASWRTFSLAEHRVRKSKGSDTGLLRLCLRSLAQRAEGQGARGSGNERGERRCSLRLASGDEQLTFCAPACRGSLSSERGRRMAMTHIVGIAGSLRRASFNLGLLRAAAAVVPNGATLEARIKRGSHGKVSVNAAFGDLERRSGASVCRGRNASA